MKQRKSPRIPDRDYSAPDCYMITINTHRRHRLFGDIVDGQMQRSDFGTIVRGEWLRTAKLRPDIVIDEFIVMPDHFHAILALIDAFLRGRGAPRPYDRDGIAYRLYQAAFRQTAHRIPTADHRFAIDRMGGAGPAPSTTTDRAGGAGPAPLSTTIGAFKSAVTKRINAQRETPGATVWQRGFHDHVIRDALELDLYRQYIRENPQRWARRHSLRDR